MNITFLLGNGFDRALGLKTGYSDFYEWYCAQKSDRDVVNEFRASIDKDIKCTDDNATKLWSDAELGLARVTERYSIDDFVTCCEDMHDMLTEYLAGQNQKFSENSEEFPQIVQSFSSQLIEFQQDMKPTEQQLFTKLRSDNREYDSIINIVTLNYTGTCDKIHKALSAKALMTWTARNVTRCMKMGKIIHAHGYVDNFPILGVCNPELIANQQYLDNPAFRALMIKQESIKAIGETWRDDTYALIDNSNIVCIFGASMGESDSDYWQHIATWLNGSASRRLVIFWYDSNIKKTNISYYQKYITEQKVQNKFLAFTNLDESGRENLRQRIHIIINTAHMFVLPDKLKVKYPEKSKKKISAEYNLGVTGNVAEAYEQAMRTSKLLESAISPEVMDAFAKSTQQLEKIEKADKILPV